MKLLKLIPILLLISTLFVGCKGGSSLAGRWRIEQDNNAFGEGAEKGELDLNDDGSFDITMGQLTLAKGTWKAEGSNLTLSASSGKMGTSYRLENDKLIPIIDGKDVAFWRFVRK